MFNTGEDRKLSIICSKGSLDMAYPGLVLANAALMEGIDVTLFFTFWGMDIVSKKTMKNLKNHSRWQPGHAYAQCRGSIARHDQPGYQHDA